jgi:fatty acid desaturase
MNFHTEHHMYAQVPCYNLRALHEAIKHDLPPTPHGIIEVWQRIAADVQRQAKDPAYVEPVPLPTPTAAGSGSDGVDDDGNADKQQ